MVVYTIIHRLTLYLHTFYAFDKISKAVIICCLPNEKTLFFLLFLFTPTSPPLPLKEMVHKCSPTSTVYYLCILHTFSLLDKQCNSNLGISIYHNNKIPILLFILTLSFTLLQTKIFQNICYQFIILVCISM